MHNPPFVAALCDEHRVARRGGHRVSILHSRELVEPGEQDRAVVDWDCMALLYGILIAAAL